MQQTDAPSLAQPLNALPDATGGILDWLSSAVYTTDRDGVITYYNEAAAALWGREPVVGSSLWCGSLRIFTTDGKPLPHDQCPMAKCLKSGQGITTAEIVVERPDGQRRNVLVSPQPLYDDEGQMTGAVNTLSDITEMRGLEAARANSMVMVDSLLRHSLDCIKVLDLDAMITAVNPNGCDSLGVRRDIEIIGQSYFSLLDGDDRTRAEQAINCARAEGSARFRATLARPHLRDRVWDKSVSLISDGGGRPSGFLIISRDITSELREAEFRKRQLRQQETLSEIGELALRHGCLRAFMQRTIELVAETLDAPLAKILTLDDQGDKLTLRAGIGWHEGLVGTATVATETASQAGYTMMTENVVAVEDLEHETRFSGPPLLHDHGVVSGMSVTIPGTGKRPFGVIGVHWRHARRFDRAEQRYLAAVANLVASAHRHEENTKRQALLVREIAHRAGNMLQFVGSIFNQTIRNSDDLLDAKAKFEVRLAQMSRANILVSSDGWTKSDVRSLITSALEPFVAGLELEGRDVLLPAELCFDLGLVLHELATNSAKYGYFAGDGEGEKVHIGWRIDSTGGEGPIFELEWRDHPKKSTTRKPGSGFGTRLMKQLVESKWSGHIETRQDEEFVCRIALPMPKG